MLVGLLIVLLRVATHEPQTDTLGFLDHRYFQVAVGLDFFLKLPQRLCQFLWCNVFIITIPGNSLDLAWRLQIVSLPTTSLGL